MSVVADYQSGSESDSGSNKGNVGSTETAGEKVDAKANGFDNGSKVVEESNCTSKGTEDGNAERKSPAKLPSASSVLKKTVPSENSVLKSEYTSEEEKKTKVLEQHVKMVNNAKSVPVNGKVNGKMVCWMYRRGRCRLGKKCKMYHDSELRTTEEKQKSSAENKHPEKPALTPSSQKRTYDETIAEEKDDVDGPKSKIQKKRFGLSDDLVPSKKVIQHLEMINKESQPGH